ncbi:MAG TPA: type II toxin-antitoxin system mRNA interferase toxin, RelE/StbE family [Pyrinomonadaceae bacterium]|nr:type II toxin-antitoxin system mRNA interferase toxin, RelE/StbE family [Pyrinomonadaceae bacterium]
MKLLSTPSFVRSAKRMVKRNPKFAEALKETLALLEKDLFDPQLKTHKLKGVLEGSWACRVAYDLRIVFEIVQFDDEETILLQTIGTHDEVY